MSKDWYQDIVDFNKEIMECQIPDKPVGLGKDKRELWGNLIIEEVSELLAGMDKDDLREMADGGADAVVVILGAMVNAGIDLRPIWDEVHRTNMLKKGGQRREDGKLLKPEGWRPPAIAELIKMQQTTRKCSECGWVGKESDCGFGHNDFYCPSCCKEVLEMSIE